MATFKNGNVSVTFADNYTPSDGQTVMYNAIGRNSGFNPLGWIGDKINSAENAIGTTISAGVDFARSGLFGGTKGNGIENISTENMLNRQKESIDDVYRKYGFNGKQDFDDQLYSAERSGNQAEADRLLNIAGLNDELKGVANTNATEAKNKANAYQDYRKNSYIGQKVNQNNGKFAGSALNTLSTMADIAGMATGAPFLMIPNRVIGNGIQGAIGGVANELEQNGGNIDITRLFDKGVQTSNWDNFDWGRAGQNALIGGASGLASGAFNNFINGKNFIGGSGDWSKLANKAIQSQIGRGALSGAVGGAVGGGLGAGLNGGDWKQGALQGAGQGALSGAVNAGVMQGATKLGGAVLNKVNPQLAQKIADNQKMYQNWRESGKNFNERLTNTLNSGESGLGNWLNRKSSSKLLNRIGETGVGLSIKDTSNNVAQSDDELALERAIKKFGERYKPFDELYNDARQRLNSRGMNASDRAIRQEIENNVLSDMAHELANGDKNNEVVKLMARRFARQEIGASANSMDTQQLENNLATADEQTKLNTAIDQLNQLTPESLRHALSNAGYSEQEFLDLLTNNNAHTERVLAEALLTGNEDYINRAKQILNLQASDGYLTPNNKAFRDELAKDIQAYNSGQRTTQGTGSQSVRDWYMKNYADDDLGGRINQNLTFDQLKQALQNGVGGDIYNTIGVQDSVIRERLFNQLVNQYGGTYGDYYDQWINGGNGTAQNAQRQTEPLMDVVERTTNIDGGILAEPLKNNATIQQLVKEGKLIPQQVSGYYGENETRYVVNPEAEWSYEDTANMAKFLNDEGYDYVDDNYKYVKGKKIDIPSNTQNATYDQARLDLEGTAQPSNISQELQDSIDSARSYNDRYLGKDTQTKMFLNKAEESLRTGKLVNGLDHYYEMATGGLEGIVNNNGGLKQDVLTRSSASETLAELKKIYNEVKVTVGGQAQGTAQPQSAKTEIAKEVLNALKVSDPERYDEEIRFQLKDQGLGDTPTNRRKVLNEWTDYTAKSLGGSVNEALELVEDAINVAKTNGESTKKYVDLRNKLNNLKGSQIGGTGTVKDLLESAGIKPESQASPKISDSQRETYQKWLDEGFIEPDDGSVDWAKHGNPEQLKKNFIAYNGQLLHKDMPTDVLPALEAYRNGNLTYQEAVDANAKGILSDWALDKIWDYSDAEARDAINELRSNAWQNGSKTQSSEANPQTAKDWAKRAIKRIGEDLDNKGVGLSIKPVDNTPSDEQTEVYRTLMGGDGSGTGDGTTPEEFESGYGQSKLATGETRRSNFLSRAGRALEASQAGGTRKENRDIGIENAGDLINTVRKRTGISDIETQAQLARELTGGKDSLLDNIQRQALTATEDGSKRTVDLTDLNKPIEDLIYNASGVLLPDSEKQKLYVAVIDDLTNNKIDTISKANNMRAVAHQLYIKDARTPDDSSRLKANILSEIAGMVEDKSYKAVPKDNVDAMFETAQQEALSRAKVATQNGKKNIAKAYTKLANEIENTPHTIGDFRHLKKDFVDISKLYTKTSQGATAWNSYSNNAIIGSAIAGAFLSGNPLTAIPTAVATKMLAPAIGESANTFGAKIGGKIADLGDMISDYAVRPTTPATDGQTVLYNALGRENGLNSTRLPQTDNESAYVEEVQTAPVDNAPVALLASSGNVASDVYTPSADETAVYDSLANSGTTTNGYTRPSLTTSQATGNDFASMLERAMQSASEAGDAQAFGTLYQMYQNATSKNSSDMTNPVNWNSADRTKLINAQNGLSQIDTLANAYVNATGNGGDFVSGNLRNFGNMISGGNLDPTASNYNDLAQSVGMAIIKNLVNLGVTESDAERYKQYLPALTDSAEKAQMKLETLRRLYQDQINNLYSTYGA